MSGCGNCKLVRRVPDSNPSGLDDYGGVDRGWTCSVDFRSPDREDLKTSVVLVVVPGKPRVTRRGSDDDGNGCSMDDGSPDSWTGVRTG